MGLYGPIYGPMRWFVCAVLFDFFRYFGDFLSNIRFSFKITWFLSFSGKLDAESYRNLMKNSVLGPKRAKFVQKSYGKFTESLRNFQDLSRRTHKGPYGPIYGPIWAPTRTGPQPGLGPNPDWAPTRTGSWVLHDFLVSCVKLFWLFVSQSGCFLV